MMHSVDSPFVDKKCEKQEIVKVESHIERTEECVCRAAGTQTTSDNAENVKHFAVFKKQ